MSHRSIISPISISLHKAIFREIYISKHIKKGINNFHNNFRNITQSSLKLDDSGNYREIGICSLLVLIINDTELEHDEHQFGFQSESSTSMCTWTAKEVINYFNGSESPVFAYVFTIYRRQRFWLDGQMDAPSHSAHRIMRVSWGGR